MQQQANAERGFTLLEIMLVVILLSLITLGGMSLFHVRINNFRIDKTAMQMQQWLQAGQNYYADSGVWPSKFDELKRYLPVNSERNAWGLPIEIAQNQMQSDPLFHITTTLPEIADARGSNSMRIAGHLPNAKADPNKHQVTTEVTAPTSANSLESGQRIVSIQNVAMPLASSEDVQKRIHLPTNEECPVETHQTHIFYAISEAHFNVSQRVPHLLKHINGLPNNWQTDVKATLQPSLEARAIITHSDKQEMEDPENWRHVGADHQFANKEGALLAIVTCEKIATSSLTPPPLHSNFVF